MADRSVVIRLIADTGSYEQGMRRATSATQGLEGAGRASIVTLGSLGRLAGGLLGGSILAVGIGFDALKQRSQAAFTTIMGSARAAKIELADLYGQFKSNPFGYPQILKSSQQLLAMGVNAKDLVRTVRDISDATAAVGGSADILDRVALAIGQMKAKGTIQAEELRQLAENGIPAWQLLAKEIGVSVPEAMKMVQRREIDSQQGVDALLSGIESRFGGATANLRDTWTGTLQAFKAEATQAAGAIVQPIVRIGTDGMHAIQPLLHGLGQLGNGFSHLSSPVQNTLLVLGAVMLMSGRLNSAWARGTSSLRTFGDQMRVQQALAAASGASLSRLGAVATVTGFRLRAMGSSISSAFGGPIGIALTVATLGLSYWQQKTQAASAAAEKMRQDVDNLSQSLDLNTLRLGQNGQAEMDKLLTQSNIGDSGTSIIRVLDALHINAQLARRALAGDADAWKQLQAAFKAAGHGWDQSIYFRKLKEAVDNLDTSIGETAQQMQLRIPDAAKAVGVSSTVVTKAFDQWRAKGGDLSTVLRTTGFDAAQVGIIMRILGGDAQSAAYSFGSAATYLEQLQGDLQGTVSSFVSVAGAWDTAKSNLQASVSAGGSAPSGGTPSIGDDPAVKAAKAAIAAFRQQRYETDAALAKKVTEAKTYEETEKRKADAADAAASRAKKAWEAAKKAATDADSALDKAKDRKAQADQDARDAANILAAVQTDQALTAGGPDAAAWAAAHARAASAASTTSAAATAADAAAAAAQGRVTQTHGVQASAYDVMIAAQHRATLADRQEKAAAAELERAQQHLSRVRQQEAQQYQKLLATQQRAEDRARQSTEAMAAGGSSAVSNMVKDIEPSLQQYLDELDKEKRAQENWKDNLITLAAKIPPGVAIELAKLGPTAAPLVAKLVNGTKAQLNEFVKDFPSTTKTGVNDIVTELTEGIPLIAAVGKVAGAKMAAQLSDAIRTGKTTVSEAMRALQGTMDKNSLSVKLGLSNKAAIAQELNDLLSDHVYKFRRITYQGQPAFTVQGGLIGYAKGGWIRGGSGQRDDVVVPYNRGRNALAAMGGEFMVKKNIAQRNKPFFDEMDRTGRFPSIPAPTPAPTVVYVTAPGADSRVYRFEPTIVQQPGQSARDQVNEFARLLPLSAAGRN